VRRKRDRDPALNNLIEIKEDDVKVGMETYRKNLSEESIEKMYKPVSSHVTCAGTCRYMVALPTA